mmetsp:Transcript_49370/g.98996  ORF Transcript_49370/g.98996 Transcript_49370/m.98996 type:complete len:212 (-) Transcript_49370:263-898(-)
MGSKTRASTMGSMPSIGLNHASRSACASIDRIISLNSSSSTCPFSFRSASVNMRFSSGSVGRIPSSSSARCIPRRPIPFTRSLSAPSATFSRTRRPSSCMNTSRALRSTDFCISCSIHCCWPSRSSSGCVMAALPLSHGGCTPATPGSMHEALTQSQSEARSEKLPSSEPSTTGRFEKRPDATTFMGWCLSFSLNVSQFTGSSSCMMVFIG